MFVLKKSKDKPPITTNPTTSPTTGASSTISTTNTISSVTSTSNNDKRLSLTSANLARLFLSKPTPSQDKNTPSPASASQIPKINIESSLNMYSNPTSPNNQKSSLIVNASPTSNSSFLKSKSKQKRRKQKKRIKNMRKKFHYPEDTSQLIRYSDIDFGYGSDYEFSFSDLPDEIIVQIFQYIPVVYLAKNFSVVSKKFAMMWIRGVHTVQVLGPLRKLNEDAFVKFVRKFSFLEVLDLCNSGSSEDFQITDKGLLQLAHKYIYSNADYLAMPPAIDPISGNFDLNFDYEQHLDSIDESASLYSSTAFDTQSYNGEDDDNTEAIGEEDDDVTSTASTDVSSFTNTKFNKQITATPFNVLYNQRSFGFTPKRNPNSREPNYGLQTLHTLNVQGCHYITDNGVKYLTYISQNLTHLNLRGCTKVNDSAMSYISQFSQLNFLDMTGCVNVTDLGVKHLSQSACKTKLKYLDLTFCHQVTDEGVKYLSEMTELEDLTLQCCRHITAKGLSQLVNSCQNIRVLNLTGCHLLEISGVRSGSLPKLEKLSMMGCKLTSDNCLKVISDWTSNLKELVLSFSDMITDAGIARVITNSKNLSHLNLKKCSNITDKSLECISKHLNNVIEYINLTGVRGFTNDGFKYLENCTSLKELVIQRCIHVNNEGISHLLHCPSLEILDISENTLITGDEILKLCKKGQLKQLKIEKCKISKEVINTISQTVLVTQ